MPIKQRCPICRQFVRYGTRWCPNTKTECSGQIHPAVYLVKKVSGKLITRSLGICTRADAEREHAKFLLELNCGITASPPMLGDVLDALLARMEAEGKLYHQKVRLFFERANEFFGNTNVAMITPDRAIQFQTWLRASGISPAYADRHVAMVKAAWTGSVWGRPNPFSQVKLFRPDNTLIRWLTDDEETKLLDAAKQVPHAKGLNRGGMAPRHFHEIVLLAIYTGLRETNILRLQRDEVDLENRILIVRQKRDRRHVAYMNRAVHEMLDRIQPTNGSPWFFVSPRTRRPFIHVAGSFAAAKKIAGITKPFRFHDLRHHAATKLLRLTKNLRLVQLFLGHSNISVTEKYAHVIADDQRAAVEQLCNGREYQTKYQLGIDDAIELLSRHDSD